MGVDGQLALTRYRVTVEAPEPLVFPGLPRLDASWRLWLRFPEAHPEPCPIPTMCPYHLVFETAPPPDAAALRAHEEIPRPFHRACAGRPPRVPRRERRPRMNDTPPDVAGRYRELLLQRSGEERLKMGCSMHAAARAFVLASVLERDRRLTRRAPGSPLSPLLRSRVRRGGL